MFCFPSQLEKLKLKEIDLSVESDLLSHTPKEQEVLNTFLKFQAMF